MNVGCDIQLIMKTRKICTKEEYSKQVKTLVDTGFKHYNFDFFAAEKTAPLYDDNYENGFMI